MSRVGMAIKELHRAENDLAGQLLRMSDRHKVEHEIFHLARDLAAWSQEHVRELARVGEEYDVELDPEPQDDRTVLARLRQTGSELAGRRHEVALLLLHDLREVHRTAAGVSLDWEILAQTAQALKDRDLLALSQGCHPDTQRQMKWAEAMLKELSPQAMATG